MRCILSTESCLKVLQPAAVRKLRTTYPLDHKFDVSAVYRRGRYAYQVTLCNSLFAQTFGSMSPSSLGVRERNGVFEEHRLLHARFLLHSINLTFIKLLDSPRFLQISQNSPTNPSPDFGSTEHGLDKHRGDGEA
ncbi:hypothetical protein I7I51_04720 [Histoplasma capsulatum]|uniref:Uncharacterized protein n=1 Tax=Ajellomyces capsulatus TaxID=5037 RepID=A0A8A1M5K3_AJECA|nr:hypothetical protein I7I51_04720 [Histoplasma capsulatum]